MKKLFLKAFVAVSIINSVFFANFAKAIEVFNETDPSFRIGQGTAISVNVAQGVFGSATIHSNSAGDIYFANRNPEIKDLARALGAEDAASDQGVYVDRVYDYVRNNFDVEPMFGSRKGPLGAFIDANGTAFDLAQLMVELLDEGGITANYQLGTIQITTAQAANWLGVTKFDGAFNAAALADILADSGIPADISGSTVTMMHVWVTADFEAQTYHFDPSYKQYNYFQGVNLATALGYSQSSFLTSAGSGLVNGSSNGITTISNINESGISSQLKTASGNLLSWIENNDPVSNVDDILGRREILRQDPSVDNWRLTTYGTSTISSWSAGNGIPDQYRTQVTLNMSDTVQHNDGSFVLLTFFNNINFFTDETYGQRFWIDASPGLADFNIRLKVGEYIVASSEATQPGGGNDLHVINRRNANLTLDVDYPYAASSGAYLDKVVNFITDYIEPIAILQGFGDVSSNMMAKHGAEMSGQTRIIPIFSNCEIECTVLDGPRTFMSKHIKMRLADSWLTQFSTMASQQARVGNGRVIHHGSFGVSYSQTGLLRNMSGANSQPYSVDSDSVVVTQVPVRISIDTAVSVRSKDALSADQNALRQSLAVSAATIEGSLFEQLMGAVDGTSTASRFRWANQLHSIGTSLLFEDAGQQRFALTTGTNILTAGSAEESWTTDIGEPLLAGFTTLRAEYKTDVAMGRAQPVMVAPVA
jgi:hypothetical protein